MFLLQQEIISKKLGNKQTSKLKFKNINNNNTNKNHSKYNTKAIRDSMVYIKELKSYLPKLYCLILKKGYYKKNISKSLYWPSSTSKICISFL